jgi:hypothetical protein
MPVEGSLIDIDQELTWISGPEDQPKPPQPAFAYEREIVDGGPAG